MPWHSKDDSQFWREHSYCSLNWKSQIDKTKYKQIQVTVNTLSLTRATIVNDLEVTQVANFVTTCYSQKAWEHFADEENIIFILLLE